jgi:hypothetical protein
MGYDRGDFVIRGGSSSKLIMDTYETLVRDWINFAKTHPAALKVEDMLYKDSKGICKFIDDVLRIDCSDEVVNEVAMGLINDGCNHYGDLFLEELRQFSRKNIALKNCLDGFEKWKILSD